MSESRRLGALSFTKCYQGFRDSLVEVIQCVLSRYTEEIAFTSVGSAFRINPDFIKQSYVETRNLVKIISLYFHDWASGLTIVNVHVCPFVLSEADHAALTAA